MIRESLRFDMGDGIQQLAAVAAGLESARKANDSTAEAMLRLRMAEADVSDEMLQLARVAAGLDARLSAGTIDAREHAEGMRLVERRLAEATSAGSGFSEAADQASGRLMKLGGALDVISPQAGALARVAGDLADGLSLVGTSSGMLLVGLGALAAGFVAMVAGVGLGVAGLFALVQSSDEAADSLQELQRLAGVGLVDADAVREVETAAAAMDSVRTSAQAAGLALAAEFSPYVREASLVAVELLLALRDLIDASAGFGMLTVDMGRALLEGLVSPIRAALDMLASLEDGLASVADALGQTGAAESYRAAAASLREVVDEGLVGSAWDALTARLSGYRDQAERLTAAQVRLNHAIEDGADVSFKSVNLLDQLLAQAEASLQEDIAGAGRRASDALTDFRAALEGLVPPQNLSALDRLAGLEADLAIAFSRGELSASRYAAALAEVAGARRTLSDQALAEQIMGGVGLAGSIGGAITSGSISDLVGAIAPAIGTAIAGPVGAAVGAAVGEAVSAATSFLEDLGAAGGAGAITANLNQSVDNIVAGIEALPELLLMGLPEVLGTLGRELIVELPEAFGAAMYEALEEWWASAQDNLRDALTGAGGEGWVRRAVVNATRAVSAFATAGASEVVLGAANAASDGRIKDALYGRDGSTSRTVESRQGAQRALQARAGQLQALRPPPGEMVQHALVQELRRADNVASAPRTSPGRIT